MCYRNVHQVLSAAVNTIPAPAGQWYDYLMPLAATARTAWSALRKSTVVLRTADLPGMTEEIAAGLPEKRSTCTGCSPALAIEQLCFDGMDPAQAALLVRTALLSRFRAFAYSWSSYISNHGWMQEMKLLPEPQRAQFVQRFFGGQAPDFASLVQQGQSGMLQALPLLLSAGARLGKLEQGEYDSNPTWVMLTQRHGMAPELAAAVISQCRAAPLWMIPVIALLGLACAGIFLAAISRPDDPAFAGMHQGLNGLLGRSILCIMAFGLIAGAGYMAWDWPRRERQAQEHLARYRAQ